jgi:hypothetical protein
VDSGSHNKRFSNRGSANDITDRDRLFLAMGRE